MASSKGPIRAHINQAVHAAFPPARVASLVEEGSLPYELELWLGNLEGSIPSQWRRDWDAVALKYALAALAGEGITWEPRRTNRIYAGDLALCQVGSQVPERTFISGGYGSRNGRVTVRKFYTPEMEYTQQQGDGDFAVIDGVLHRISWPVFGPRDPRAPGLGDFDDWLGDSPF